MEKSIGTCAKCGAPATTFGQVARDPEWAARCVASVHGVLYASDFKRALLCEDCSS